jgi:hypothetical protein
VSDHSTLEQAEASSDKRGAGLMALAARMLNMTHEELILKVRGAGVKAVGEGHLRSASEHVTGRVCHSPAAPCTNRLPRRWRPPKFTLTDTFPDFGSAVVRLLCMLTPRVSGMQGPHAAATLTFTYLPPSLLPHTHTHPQVLQASMDRLQRWPESGTPEWQPEAIRDGLFVVSQSVRS